MHIRSLIFLGLCAVIGLSAPAFAEAPAKTFHFPSKASKAAEAEARAKAENGPKKKLTAKEKAKQKALAKAKAKEEAKLAAAAKAEEEAKIAAKAKAAEEKKLAKAKALEAKQLAARARADAEAQRKLTRIKAAEDAKLARAKAAEDARQAELAQLASLEIAQTGNNGELRSEAPNQPKPGFFQALFGSPQSNMLAETRALDAVLQQKQGRKKFKVKSDFEPQSVDFGGYPRGTIVIDTTSRYLYLVESSSSARRYAIAVGREGLEFKGTAKVGDKQEWPRWIPTLDMQKREPKKYGQYKDGMPGGPENPLGARAIYLYQGKKDTHIRIHGTNQPQTIGTNSSNGCFRMVNDHVMDLYGRVKVGTEVVVM